MRFYWDALYVVLNETGTKIIHGHPKWMGEDKYIHVKIKPIKYKCSVLESKADFRPTLLSHSLPGETSQGRMLSGNPNLWWNFFCHLSRKSLIVIWKIPPNSSVSSKFLILRVFLIFFCHFDFVLFGFQSKWQDFVENILTWTSRLGFCLETLLSAPDQKSYFDRHRSIFLHMN